MSGADVVVVLVAVGLIAGLGWFFFGPRRARAARIEGGVQRVRVRVRGGYTPDLIKVRQGVPVELRFDRQETGECTSRVVFPDLRVSAALPAYERTTVRLSPRTTGAFGFACGMNMIHGTLVVEPAEGVPAGEGPVAAAGAFFACAADLRTDSEGLVPRVRRSACRSAASAACASAAAPSLGGVVPRARGASGPSCAFRPGPGSVRWDAGPPAGYWAACALTLIPKPWTGPRSTSF